MIEQKKSGVSPIITCFLILRKIAGKIAEEFIMRKRKENYLGREKGLKNFVIVLGTLG